MDTGKILFLALVLSASGIFPGTRMMAESPATNPLEVKIDQSDPVIPLGYGKRELSSFEKYRIQKAITELNLLANEQLQQGKQNKAFELWYRQLKLTRVIDTEAEIEALGEVGAIAWQENRGSDVRNIAERLIEIETELTASESPDLELLNKFSTAYQQVRYLDRAVSIQAMITKISRRSDDYSLATEEANLLALGKLYLAKFDYQNAAIIYQSLLSLNNENPQLKTNNKVEQYLISLINIYHRTGQANQSLASKKQLVKHYQQTKRFNKIAKIEIAIAQDYAALEKIPQAIAAYERTVKLSEQTNQLAIANDALSKLAQLYRARGQNPQAISTYVSLVKLQQQSYDYYGLLNTYDVLGTIYLASNQKKAKQYFRQALELAQSLNYRINYFKSKIDGINI